LPVWHAKPNVVTVFQVQDHLSWDAVQHAAPLVLGPDAKYFQVSIDGDLELTRDQQGVAGVGGFRHASIVRAHAATCEWARSDRRVAASSPCRSRWHREFGQGDTPEASDE
jgi:hypothetical protein